MTFADFPKHKICFSVPDPYRLKETLSAFIKAYTEYTKKNGAENWLLPQLNTNYDDYILQLDGAPPPPIFTEMYECF
jgi:hypothetical protein